MLIDLDEELKCFYGIGVIQSINLVIS